MAPFGERLRVVRGSTAGILSDATTSVYTDVSTGQVGTALDLFADPASLWSAVVEVLRRAGGGLSIHPPAPPAADALALFETALQSATFDGDRVIIPLPVGFTAPELQALPDVPASDADRPVYVAVDGAIDSDTLTALGMSVADAAGPFAVAASAGASLDRSDCDLVPCMALTFDDGPSELTPGILDVLRDGHAAATFYMIGQNAAGRPDTVKRVVADGHQVGNHTWNHPDLMTLDDGEVASQLSRTARVLRDLSGQPVATFRPPYGSVDDRIVGIAGARRAVERGHAGLGRAR